MANLKVNHKNYTLFNYSPYLDRNCNEIPRPAKVTYDLGDVVYIKNENSIGVVLGCIHEACGEVRTDMDGMQHFGNLEPATLEHFKKPNVIFKESLLQELEGKLKRKYDDQLLDALVVKYERRGAEVKRGFLFDTDKTNCIINNNNVYLSDSNGIATNRVGDFKKKSDAVEFADELELTILNKPLRFS